jgi:hypothetical protein
MDLFSPIWDQRRAQLPPVDENDIYWEEVLSQYQYEEDDDEANNGDLSDDIEMVIIEEPDISKIKELCLKYGQVLSEDSLIVVLEQMVFEETSNGAENINSSQLNMFLEQVPGKYLHDIEFVERIFTEVKLHPAFNIKRKFLTPEMCIVINRTFPGLIR